MSKDMVVEISDALKKVVNDWRKDLADLGLSLIDGKLLGHGHTLVKVDKWQDELKKFPLSDESFAVLHVEYADVAEKEIVEEVSLSIKIGVGNLWLFSNLVNVCVSMEDEDCGDDDDDYGYNARTEEEQAAINFTALVVAKEKIFGSFKNRDQRKDFITSFVKKNRIENLPRDSEYHIACQAEVIYEYGLLPSQARELQEQGMSINEIAKVLEITKAKAQKVVVRDIPDNIRDLMSTL